MHQRRAFTIVELLTAISVLAILSTLAVVGFNRSRQSSRDSRRKSDVSAYTAGVGLYHAYSGSYFIVANASCTVPSLNNNDCTGVGGEAYGRINAAGDQPGVQYTGTSIAQALKSKSFINNIGLDPLNTGSGEQPDYVYVRCSSDGTQDFGTTNDGFAIWTKLESTIDATSAQYTNSSHYCGGSTSNASAVTRYNFGYAHNDSGIFPSPEFTSGYEAAHAYYSIGDGAFASAGAGGSNSSNTPDFTLLATPGSQSVPQGATASYTVTVGVLDGFNNLTNLGYSGLPANTTASFTPTSVAGAGTATLKIVTTSSTPVGAVSITITGTSGSLIHTVTVGLNVTSAGNSNPDFTLGVTPTSQSVTQGTPAVYTVTLGILNGFNGVTNLSYSGLPANTTANFNPTSVTGAGTSAFTVTTTASTPVGAYTIVITGTSGNIIHTAAVGLTITAGSGSNNPDFTIGAAPLTLTVYQNTTATYTTTLGVLNGFNDLTNLTYSGLPANTTASFTPSSITGAGTSIFKVITTTSTPLGSSVLTLTGTSGSTVHTATVTLVVAPPAVCVACIGGKP